MAFVRGKDGQVWITDSAGIQRELSSFVTTVDDSLTAEELDTTTIGGTSYKSSIRGFLGYSGSINGLFDNGSTAVPDKYLQDLINAASTVTSTLTLAPAGSAAGRRYTQATVNFTSYDRSVPVDGMVTFTANFSLASGSVTAGTF